MLAIDTNLIVRYLTGDHPRQSAKAKAVIDGNDVFVTKRHSAKKPAHEAPIRPLRSEADYNKALAEIERYFHVEPKPGTSAADRFDLLALVIQDYEDKRWPIEPPDPIQAIRWRMETAGYTQTDLGRLIGSRQRASDILSRKLRLTMGMAWKLHRKWGIPAEALIRPQPRSRRRLPTAVG